MHHYWGYGLHIASEIEFPELLPFEFETPNVTIRLGRTPEQLDGDDVVHRVRVDISPREYLLKLLNIANYYVANGNEIIVQPLPDGDEKSIRLFLLSNAMAAILYQRNMIPLHASGIFHKDGVVLFCGQSGVGKSTLVAALQQKGYQVFSDDVCVLRQDFDGNVTVVPSYPVIKLWQDSFKKIGLPMAGEDKRIRPELPKYANHFHDQFEISPKKIQQVFILDQSGNFSGAKIQTLTTIEAFKELQKNCYRLLQLNAMKKRNVQFEMISSLTKNIQIYKSHRSSHENTLTDLLANIENKFI